MRTENTAEQHKMLAGDKMPSNNVPVKSNLLLLS